MNQLNGLEVAVIGMTGRFPGARNLTEFWHNIRDGVESVSWFTDDQLQAAGVDPSLFRQPNYVKARATLADVDLFDAPFFDFNPKEAAITDPQHRILLEVAWEALEQAGYDPDTYSGLIGVYAGVGFNSYLLNLVAHPEVLKSVDRFQLMLANDKDFACTRVSYKLNLQGPSHTVQTACSTSLVAVHLACRSLLSGECDMALAGGITVSAQQTVGYLHHEGSIASPDGHCRAFDAQAQGTVPGNGVGLVVLKRLEDAIADGDYIHAVIKGSALNNDGASKVSYTAPRIDSQAAVIRTAQQIAEVDPDSIRYIEAHGTGTTLGDPIEIAALTQAVRTGTQKTGFCAIGSVKTNVGHLDTAAGIAGFIKTVLALQHRQIPPSLHFEQPNPHIDFANSPFYVNTQLTDWPSNGIPRRAGVSSFGIGGTNAHVVLEEAPTGEPPQPARPWQLLLLSAKTKTALDTATANLATLLQHSPHPHLADIAYTLQVGRQAFAHRRMVVCQPHDASAVLASSDPQRLLSGQATGAHRAIAFLFPGQGSQYPGMAKELYETEPTFRAVVETCCQLLLPALAVDLREILFPTAATHDCERLNQTRYAQPALFVVEYALAHLWMSWGIQPAALLGHSIGELVAACLAGVFCLEDALTLVVRRAELMQQCPTGAMLSVPLSAAQLQPWLGSDITLAVSNAPSLSVVSGSQGAIASLSTELAAKGVEARLLHTSHGFHSALMAPAVEPLIAAVEQVRLHPPQIPVLSNVTGTWLTAAQATDPHYWGEQLRQTVQFASCLKELVQDSSQILLEVGPGRTLTTLAKQQATAEQLVLASLRHPQQEESDSALLLQSLGRLWLGGVEIDWSGFYAHERRQRVPLPTYPFERQRYWIEPQPAIPDQQPSSSLIMRQSDRSNWFYLPTWKRTPPVVSDLQAIASSPSCWLLLLDATGFGQQLARQLEQIGQTVITVTPGEQFAQHGDRQYTLNPSQAKEYEKLVQALHTQPLHRVVHCWSIDAEADNETSQRCGFYSLIYLTQALVPHHHSLSLHVVTHHLQDVMGTESPIPAKATLSGACKVIPQEYPQFPCQVIDVVLPSSNDAWATQLIQALLAEFTHPDGDTTVAYRGTRRWIQTFAPMPLPAAPSQSRLRKGGTYLIAGDLVHGLGCSFAMSLIERWQANVSLVGNTGLPARTQWQHWLANHPGDDPVSRQIHQWQALEATGARVYWVEADVTDVAQMRQAIAHIEQQVGSLQGVIYTPAINAAHSIRAIADVTPANSDAELSARMQGLHVLETVLGDRHLDFGLVQSSLACVLGGVGLATYAASYFYVDAVVNHLNRRSHTPWFSINRQAWHSDEPDHDPTSPTSDALDLAMTPQEVWEAIERVLAMSVAEQVVVSTGSLSQRMSQPSPVGLKKQQAVSLPQSSPFTSARANVQTPYEAPRTKLEQAIAVIWQELLGIEQVSIHDNFFELGGHSLLAIQVTSRLRQQFAVELPLKSILFDAPTVAGLAQVIHDSQSPSNEQTIAALLEDVKNLSPDEVQRYLKESHSGS